MNTSSRCVPRVFLAGWLAFAFVALVHPPPAMGQNSPATEPLGRNATLPDTVSLRDGTILHGRITEIRPTATLTMVLPDRTERVVALSDIVTGQGPDFTIPRQPDGAASTPAPVADDLRQPGPGRVPLRVESVGRQLSIGESLGEGRHGPWGHELCYSPCTLYVAPGLFPLLATGDGIIPTAARLSVGTDGLRVRMYARRYADQAPYMTWAMLSAVTAFAGWVVLIMSDFDLLGEAVALVGLGVASAVADFIALAKVPRAGLASSEPLQPRLARVAVAPVPIANGAALAATLRF